VIRGGSWSYLPKDCRSGDREQMPPDSFSDFVGFRVVRTIFD
jgi:formylglycine-generating enzyme required for sulfatase activity